MIYDTLKNGHFYFPAGSRFAKAIEYVRNFDPSQADGRYEIDGSNIYALVQSYQTKPVEQQKAEAHKKYIDVQTIVSGLERIDVTMLSESIAIEKPYDETKDAVFYKMPANFTSLAMTEGTFAIFYPQDIHRPCCNLDGTASVRKIVVKVLL